MRRSITRRLLVGIAAVAAWSSLVHQAGAVSFRLPPPEEQVVGALRTVLAEAEDTLLDIAYRQGFGFREIKRANPDLDPWLPAAGASVTLPDRYVLPAAPRQGIVVNIPEMRLYHYPAGADEVEILPIGIGKTGWHIPEGLTEVSAKVPNPAWLVPASIRRERAERGEYLPAEVPPGPDNPLGAYALRLALPGYLIHGTNRKYGIGMRVSHGCIRLYPQDIERLFARVPVGAPVRVVDQPYKAGWHRKELYLEVHPPLVERSRDAGVTRMVAEIIRATGDTRHTVDWPAAMRALDEARGVPVRIGAELAP